MFCWRNGLRAQVCNSDVKSCPVTCPAGTESRQWCSCKGVSGTFSVPAALFLEETRYTLYRTLGGPRRWSVRARRISPLTGVRTLDRPASSESLYRLSYCQCPGRFIPGRDPVYIVQDAGWTSEMVCTGPENLAPYRGSNPGPSSQ